MDLVVSAVFLAAGLGLVLGRATFTRFQIASQKRMFGRDYSSHQRATELVVALVGVGFILMSIVFLMDGGSR